MCFSTKYTNIPHFCSLKETAGIILNPGFKENIVQWKAFNLQLFRRNGDVLRVVYHQNGGILCHKKNCAKTKDPNIRLHSSNSLICYCRLALLSSWFKRLPRWAFDRIGSGRTTFVLCFKCFRLAIRTFLIVFGSIQKSHWHKQNLLSNFDFYFPCGFDNRSSRLVFCWNFRQWNWGINP